MHPFGAFTTRTLARPILSARDPETATAVYADYDAAMQTAYHTKADGSVLFPFRRLFFTLYTS